MPLEAGTYISDLNVLNPAGTDAVSQADDHLRLIKSTLKATFPNITGAVAASQTEIAAALAASGTVPDGYVTPAKLSTGHPTWDTSGNFSTAGTGTFGGAVTATSINLSDYPRVSTRGTGFTNVNASPIPSNGTLAHFAAPDSTQGAIVQDTFAATGSNVFRRANGTAAAKTGLVANDQIGRLQAMGYDSSNAYSSSLRAAIALRSAETWTASAHGTDIQFQTTPLGSTAAATVLVIGPDGLFTGAVVGTAADTLAGSASGKFVSPAAAWGTVGVNVIASAASYTPDMNVSCNHSFTANQNFTLNNPTNIKIGQSGMIAITQDGTGSRTITYGSAYKFPSGAIKTLSTGASTVDVLFYTVLAGGYLLCSLQKAYA